VRLKREKRAFFPFRTKTPEFTDKSAEFHLVPQQVLYFPETVKSLKFEKFEIS
jgi:hypothetical protein